MLTQPLNEAPADQRTSQIEERLVDIGSPLVAYLQVPVAVQPSLRCMLEYVQAVVPLANQQESAVGNYAPNVYRWRVFWGVLTGPGGNLTW